MGVEIGDAGFGADVRERPVAVVVKKMIAFAEQAHRATKDIHAAVLAGTFGDPAPPCQDRTVEIVVDVAGDEEV